MIIGFTGTRRGMTEAQQLQIRRFLTIRYNPSLVVHGGCHGADLEFDDLAIELQIRRRCRPAYRKVVRNFDEQFEPKEPLDRNRDIVLDADLMLATPGEDKEVLRSGTWATIRYARKAYTPIIIIYPDGHHCG